MKILQNFAIMITAVSVLMLANRLAAEETQAVTAPASSREIIEKKIKTIVFDHLDFDHADIKDVLQFLTTKSRQLDADKVGVSFVLQLDPGTGATSHPNVYRTVSIKLDNVPLSDVLIYIQQQTNLSYTVNDYAIYLCPAVSQAKAAAPVNKN